ncbi:MAG TPA: M36 family metallopeptidase [Thermoanaerobaculia bacterium]
MNRCRLMAALLLLGFATGPGAVFAALDIPEIHKARGDFDARQGSVAPSPAALDTARALGGNARWTRFGTIHTLSKDGGFLAVGLQGDPEQAARSWIRSHRELFGLSAESVDNLELVRDSVLTGGSAHVLLFGQRVGDVPVMHEGRIKMGIVDGKLFWVASSSIGEAGALGEPVLGATQAWLRAAAFLGLPTGAGSIGQAGQDESWTLLNVAGLSHPQRARLVALGMPGAGAVPAYETIVLNVTPAETLGYTVFVDAVSGQVLVGQNRVHRAAEGGGIASVSAPVDTDNQRTETYQGEYPPSQGSQCGPCHGPFTAAPTESWSRLVATLAGTVAANDMTLTVYAGDPTCNSNSVAGIDLLFGTEVAIYEPGGGVPAGDYYVEVCPFNATQIAPTSYTGTVTFEGSPEINTNPKWRFFPANPPLDHSTADTRILGCWFDELSSGASLPECQAGFAGSSSHNIAWDFNPVTNLPSNTTTGNNDRASEAWAAFLSGGGPYQPQVTSPDPSQQRVYDFPWTNEWFESACDPTRIVHGGLHNSNDIDAAITNLFVIHNRVHDWAYHLGLREREGVAQISNFGQTLPTKQQDPELGNAQAGALQGAPAYTGRDNANQLTLNDGIAPMTNMYLWQTIGGAIYTPCVDGDFDAAVIAHEYGHLIQNRMVDPDNGLGGDQGGAMGESWSDLTAIEFLNGFGLVDAGQNPFAVGAYVTGDSTKGIRNYAMNSSPLNYGDVGYDFACNLTILDVTDECPDIAQVHSDGEIWSATNFDIRQALISKHNASYPSGDATLQKRCASGDLPSDRCPGNRRWVQIMHDAMLLMPSTPSMVDARDAYLAADLARANDPALSWPSNQVEMWRAFARRGLGQLAASSGSDDWDPRPDYSSPHEINADITFQLVANEEGKVPVEGEVFVGRYEARATPVADTIASTPLSDTRLFAPGTYEFLVRANGYGHHRFTRTFIAGQRSIVTVGLPTNWASSAKGAMASGEGIDHAELIDDTEETNWQALDSAPSVTVATPEVTIELPTGRLFNRFQVSGMLEVQEGVVLQSRYSSIHGFRLLTCNASLANAFCTLPTSFTPIFTSPANAFPSSTLRPLVPDTTIRTFSVPPIVATHIKLEALHNKCTGSPIYQGYLGVAGQEDNDPTNSTSCLVGNPPQITPKGGEARAAELQIFGTATSVAVTPK